ncbi:MAG: hypothetical protein K6C69_02050 [Lachnospiraceae bacterium]|nr:hypothetical protein [Lachnospiraceae bacterium]
MTHMKNLLRSLWRYSPYGFAFFGLGVCIYSILTYGQTVIHSDTATAVLLWKSMKEQHQFFPMTWNYVNGDLWILTLHLFCILPMAITKNVALARCMASVCIVLVTVGGMMVGCRLLFKNHSWVISVPVIFLFMFEQHGMILYEAGYTAPILWAALCPALFYWSVKCGEHVGLRTATGVKCGEHAAPRTATGVKGGEHAAPRTATGVGRCLIFLLFFLLCLSGIRNIAEIILPLFLAYGVTFLLSAKKKDLSWLWNSLLLLVPAGGGLVVYQWIIQTHTMVDTDRNHMVLAGVREALHSFGDLVAQYVWTLYANFGYYLGPNTGVTQGLCNGITLVACTLLCFVIPIFQGWSILRKYKTQGFLKKCKTQGFLVDGTVFYFLYAMIHNAMFFVLFVFFGKVEIRYMLSSVIVLVIVSANFLVQVWRGGTFAWMKWGILVFYMAIGIEAVDLCSYSVGWEETLKEERAFNQELVDRGVTKAYATYWNAYNNAVYSNLQIQYGALSLWGNKLSPYLWLVDSRVYYPQENQKSALILSVYEKGIHSFLDEQWGEPVEAYQRNGLYVYIYDHDLMYDIPNVFLDGYLGPCEMMGGRKEPENGPENGLENGLGKDRRVTEIAGGEILASMTFTLEPGAYEFAFQGQDFGDCEFRMMNVSEEDSYEFVEVSRSEREVRYHLTVRNVLIDCGFGVYNPGAEPVQLEKIRKVVEESILK